MQEQTIIVMPDYEGAWAWDAGGTCIGADHTTKGFQVSEPLLNRFGKWQKTFEAQPLDENGDISDLRWWAQFHKEGIRLCQELKRELGPVTVVYERPVEDPNHNKKRRVEIR